MKTEGPWSKRGPCRLGAPTVAPSNAKLLWLHARLFAGVCRYVGRETGDGVVAPLPPQAPLQTPPTLLPVCAYQWV